MPNKFFNNMTDANHPTIAGAPTGKKGVKPAINNETTADWPGVPGKTQPRNRSNGVTKCKCHVKSQGI